MRRVRLCRLGLFVVAVGILEVLCLTGVIDNLTMPPPHRMVVDLARMLISGSLDKAIARTMANAGIALALSIVAGIAAAVVIHGLRRLRDGLDPLFATLKTIAAYASNQGCRGGATIGFRGMSDPLISAAYTCALEAEGRRFDVDLRLNKFDGVWKVDGFLVRPTPRSLAGAP